jgi:hypothetical protein
VYYELTTVRQLSEHLARDGMRPANGSVRFLLYPGFERRVMSSTSKFITGDSDYLDCRFEHEQLSFSARGRIVLRKFEAIDCDVVIEKGVSLFMVGAAFRRCRIESRSSKPGQADMGSFEDCVFRGTFQGWQFGGRVEAASVSA